MALQSDMTIRPVGSLLSGLNAILKTTLKGDVPPNEHVDRVVVAIFQELAECVDELESGPYCEYAEYLARLAAFRDLEELLADVQKTGEKAHRAKHLLQMTSKHELALVVAEKLTRIYDREVGHVKKALSDLLKAAETDPVLKALSKAQSDDWEDDELEGVKQAGSN